MKKGNDIIGGGLSTNAPESLKTAFHGRYPKYMKILDDFEAANGCEATWENLSRSRLARLVEYMGERVSPNSVRQYAAKLKAVLNLHKDEVGLDFDFDSALSVREVPSINTYLTEDEIRAFARVSVRGETERLIRDRFAIGCVTGARHSDYDRLGERNIKNGWISYVSRKTRVPVTIPASPLVLRLISEGSPAFDMSNVVSDTYFNRKVRELARRAGIVGEELCFKAGRDVAAAKCDLIASHTARRSCATNLAIRGVSDIWIGRILGHSRGVTARYVCCDGAGMPDNARAYFMAFE